MNQRFDHEMKRDFYPPANFTVFGRDEHGLEDEAIMHVTYVNINDHAPVFQEKHYHATVPGKYTLLSPESKALFN